MGLDPRIEWKRLLDAYHHTKNTGMPTEVIVCVGTVQFSSVRVFPWIRKVVKVNVLTLDKNKTFDIMEA